MTLEHESARSKQCQASLTPKLPFATGILSTFLKVCGCQNNHKYYYSTAHLRERLSIYMEGGGVFSLARQYGAPAMC